MDNSREQNEFVRRRTALISLDGNIDEILHSISQTLNIPLDQINRSEIQEKIRINKLNFEATYQIIESSHNFLKENKSTKDKIEELHDVGKFIKNYHEKLELLVPTSVDQVPDFLVQNNDRTIGIEHTRLIDNQIEKVIGTVRKILRKAKDNILSRNELTNTLINIQPHYDIQILGNKTLSSSLTPSELQRIAKIFENDIINTASDRSKIPAYLNVLTFTATEHPLELNLMETYSTKHSFEHLLKSAISKKEAKAVNYKQYSNISELWLLIINSGIKSSASFNLSNIDSYSITSCKFARIFLMDNFDYDIHQII
jgi:hypothetical protein